MKIIEAMKRVKANKEKISDLQKKIMSISAHLSFETPLYPNSKEKVTEWLQSVHDTIQENIRLLTAIARTNLATEVTITLGDKAVVKNIAEWVWRRREYAAMDQMSYAALTDRGLKEGALPNTQAGAEAIKVTIVRNYDPEVRDKMTEIYRREPHEIDAALEVVNAVTDLLEV